MPEFKDGGKAASTFVIAPTVLNDVSWNPQEIHVFVSIRRPRLKMVSCATVCTLITRIRHRGVSQ